MRVIWLLLLSLPALADTFPYNVNGVGYSWQWTGDTEWYGELNVQFSAPISSYQFQVTFPESAADPQVWVSLQSRPSVIWTQLQPQPYVPGGAMATVTGNTPDVTRMEISLGVDSNTPMIGGLFPLNFHFTDLVDPPAGVADAPEPSSASLVALGLFAFGLFSRKQHAKKSEQSIVSAP